MYYREVIRKLKEKASSCRKEEPFQKWRQEDCGWETSLGKFMETLSQNQTERLEAWLKG
jgi:hypothetical protein